MVDKFTKIVPSAFGSFIGHHQGFLGCIKSVFIEFLLFNQICLNERLLPNNPYIYIYIYIWRSPRGVIGYVQDYNIVESESEF